MSMGDILAAHKKNLFGVTFETTSVHIKTFFLNFILVSDRFNFAIKIELIFRY